MKLIIALTAAIMLLLGLGVNVQADVFDLGSGLANLETVAVGDAGNSADIRYQNLGYGSVGYDFSIGKYEVTAAQYCDFLNHMAKTDPYGLYNIYMDTENDLFGCNIVRTGIDGSYIYSVARDWANRPVNYVSYWDACRFVNWLHNDQVYGDTETGVYTLLGYNGYDGSIIQRNDGWTWAVASGDEWYKAAYYKGSGIDTGYWSFPTQSNIAPSCFKNSDPAIKTVNYINYNEGQETEIYGPYYRTNVGEFANSASAYGTFDQAGNVWEWTEAIVYQEPGFAFRGLRGGSFESCDDAYFNAFFTAGIDPTNESSDIGFRVSSTPGTIKVVIDIEPGNPNNLIKLGKNGLVQVALFASNELAVSDVDVSTVLFAGGSPFKFSYSDVDGDGAIDCVFSFRCTSLQLNASSTTATLIGKTLKGRSLEGADSVMVSVPKK